MTETKQRTKKKDDEKMTTVNLKDIPELEIQVFASIGEVKQTYEYLGKNKPLPKILNELMLQLEDLFVSDENE